MASMLCHYKANLDNEHAKHKTTLKDIEAELARQLEKYTLRRDLKSYTREHKVSKEFTSLKQLSAEKLKDFEKKQCVELQKGIHYYKTIVQLHKPLIHNFVAVRKFGAKVQGCTRVTDIIHHRLFPHTLELFTLSFPALQMCTKYSINHIEATSAVQNMPTWIQQPHTWKNDYVLKDKSIFDDLQIPEEMHCLRRTCGTRTYVRSRQTRNVNNLAKLTRLTNKLIPQRKGVEGCTWRRT